MSGTFVTKFSHFTISNKFFDTSNKGKKKEKQVSVMKLKLNINGKFQRWGEFLGLIKWYFFYDIFYTSMHDALDDELNIDKKDNTYHCSCFVYSTNI